MPRATDIAKVAQVFLSATAQDCRVYREAVKAAVERNVKGGKVFLQRDWVAGGHFVVDVCQQEVNTCAAYIGPFGHRYGWIPPDHTRSITELEFRWAVERWSQRDVPIFTGRTTTKSIAVSPPTSTARARSSAGLAANSGSRCSAPPPSRRWPRSSPPVLPARMSSSSCAPPGGKGRLYWFVIDHEPLADDPGPLVRNAGFDAGDVDCRQLLALPALADITAQQVQRWLKELKNSAGITLDEDRRREIARRATQPDGNPPNVYDRLAREGFWASAT
ncbi:MAG: DUF4062 domain-containing protein [Candidatus Accumulibacter phosphatis]|uniref:DUF4062 domain-containing protein n=1 Tax=Candidatus Accumulibacter phosphatis TaxID=327160 RepID=UPI001A41B2DC|nr:DUF4062 domain-containing protein [Candidatus Accumulibacter phosphatis]